MVVRKKRTTLKNRFRDTPTPWLLERLASGMDYHFLAGRDTETDLAAAWREWREWLLDHHERVYPGTLPWAAWHFDRRISDYNQMRTGLFCVTENDVIGHILTESDRAAVEQGCYFEPQRALHVDRFFKRYIKLTQGRWKDQPFIPQRWQLEKLIWPLYGWMRADGTRRFRRAFVFVPKKNGKTTLCSALSSYMLTDGEGAAETFAAATDREQSGKIFDSLCQMIRRSPELTEALKIIPSRKSVRYEDSFFKSLSGDAPSSEGKDIYFIIYDELHAWNRPMLLDLWASLYYGGAARRQPLQIVITTAGEKDDTALWTEEYNKAKSIMDGKRLDIEMLPFIAEAAEEDDWTDEATWKKANPSWGVIIKPEDMAAACEDAKSSERKKQDFLRYRINRPARPFSRWITEEAWARNAEAPLFPDGCEMWAGVDISSISDLTVYVEVTKYSDGSGGELHEVYSIQPLFWIPGETLEARRREGAMHYVEWFNKGLLNVTEGNVTDIDQIERFILERAQKYVLNELAYDPWQAQQMANHLNEWGITCVEFRQGLASYALPMRNTEKLISAARLRHGGHPILAWNAANVEVQTDINENMRPVKPNDRKFKIDGMVAMVMAIGRAMLHITYQSVYDNGVVIS